MKTAPGGPRVALLASSLLAAAWAASGQSITEFPTPTLTSRPIGIIAGPDGALWFTEQAASKIGRITTAGVITEYPTPTVGQPTGITSGPDGNLWFVEQAANNIGRITTAGVVTEFPIPTPTAQCVGITAGPDGALWFTENTTNKIGRITTGGVITEFPIPTSGAHPSGIVTGSDGALWFSEYGGVGYSGIGRITTGGSITEFPIVAGSRPVWITAGPDGALWFGESGGVAVGRMTTAGVRTDFTVPSPSASAVGIAVGADGNLWFTDELKHIGRITTGGAFTIFTTPTNNSVPESITPGPDGALWFTEYQVDKIGRITTGPTGMSYFTVPPCRVIDTRGAAGAYGSPSLGANTDRTFVIQGQCGVPITAQAVSLNVAVTLGSLGGDLRIFPGGTGLPLVSAINYNAGRARSNNAVIALGGAGDLTVRVDQPSGTAELILDVNGYFQ